MGFVIRSICIWSFHLNFLRTNKASHIFETDIARSVNAADRQMLVSAFQSINFLSFFFRNHLVIGQCTFSLYFISFFWLSNRHFCALTSSDSMYMHCSLCFSEFLQREITFVNFCLLPWGMKNSSKGGYSGRK